MIHYGKTFILSLLAAAWAPGALAAEREEGVAVEQPNRKVVREKTVLDFNDSLIDGELVKPEEGYVPGSGRIRFDSLIEFRTDFSEKFETEATSKDI